MRFIFFSIIFFVFSQLSAQVDTLELVKYSFDYNFNDGIYLDFNQFEKNNPIVFESLLFEDMDYNEEVIDIIADSKSIKYYNEFGILTEVSTYELWGYCKNGRPYVMWKNEFRLIPYIGNISHFVANITVYHESVHNPYYDPYYYNSTMPNQQYSTEIIQLLIDMTTGDIMDYNQNNISYLLQRDSILHDEFINLSKRKKKKFMFSYIRRFNDSHPLYFSKNKN